MPPGLIFETPSKRCPLRHRNGEAVEITFRYQHLSYLRRKGMLVHVYLVRFLSDGAVEAVYPDELHILPAV